MANISIVSGISPDIIKVVSLDQLVDEMRSDMHKDKTEKLRSLSGDEAKRFKISMPGFVIGKFKRRIHSELEQFCPILGFDIDHVPDPYSLVVKLSRWEYTRLACNSVSGTGVRLLIDTDCDLGSRDDYYQAVIDMISDYTGMQSGSDIRSGMRLAGFSSGEILDRLNQGFIDSVAGDISRFFFFGHHPEVSFNPDSKVFTLYRSGVVHSTGYRYEISNYERVEALVRKIEASMIDITDNGIFHWFKIASALAAEFSERGREFFHRVSKFHPKYTVSEADTEYSNALKKSGRSASIGSFFYICKEYGIYLSSEDLSLIASSHIEKRQRWHLSMNPMVSTDFIPDDDSFSSDYTGEDSVEKALVSCIIQNSSYLSEVYDNIIGFSHTMFVSIAGKVWQIIDGLDRKGLPVNKYTIESGMKNVGLNFDAGDYPVDVSPLDARKYAEMVRDNYLRRKVSMTFSNAVMEISSGKPLDQVVSKAASGMDISHSASSVDNSTPAIGDRAMNMIRDTVDRKRSGRVIGLDLGLNVENEFTGGWRDTDLVVVGARPGMGKTAYMLGKVLCNIEQGVPVGVVSLEMSGEQLFYRLASMRTGIALSKMTRGTASDEELKAIESSVEYIKGLPLYVDDTTGVNVFDIRRKAISWKAKGIKALFVDYIGLIAGTGKQNREQDVAEISRQLKLTAKELRIPVVALAQLNRLTESQKDKRPLLAHLRESGAVEQDADIVVFLFREGYYNQSYGSGAEIIYAKYRAGAVGTVHCVFAGEVTMFKDLPVRNFASTDDYEHFNPIIPPDKVGDEETMTW